jgi:hypothetical protein
MEGGIFLLQADNSLVRMNEQPYEAERLLQQLLADHSDLLAGDQINSGSPRRWLFIGREMGVPGEESGSDQWSLDHLFVDQDAVPTFVEVKRSSDTRARREVVAQMLDYAANAVTYWPVSRMRERHASMCEQLGRDATDHILKILGDDGDIEGFWNQADQNLRSGRVRLLFVSDSIPPSLRRIVEFLNQQMNPAEVLALEVKQFVGTQGETSLRTLVPRVIGQTEANREQKRTTTASQPRALVPISEFAQLFENEKHRAIVEEILDAGHKTRFELRPHATPNGNSVRMFAPGSSGDTFAITTNRGLWINISNEERLQTDEFVAELQNLLLAAFPGKRSDITDNLDRRSGLGLRFDLVETDAGLAAFLQAMALADAAVFEGGSYPPVETVGKFE